MLCRSTLLFLSLLLAHLWNVLEPCLSWDPIICWPTCSCSEKESVSQHPSVCFRRFGGNSSISIYSIRCDRLSEASVRSSVRDKGPEEGGSTYTKAGSSLRSPPGNFQTSTPITRACLLYYFVFFTYTSDFTGGCPPPPLLETELT